MDCPIAVGDTFTHSVCVTSSVYNAFVECSGDTNLLHTDDAYAHKMGYQGKLMHGAMLNAFVSGFVGTGLPVADTLCLSQKINFRAPFFLNDTIMLQAKCRTILDDVIHPNHWVVDFKLTFIRDEMKIATGTLDVRLGAC